MPWPEWDATKQLSRQLAPLEKLAERLATGQNRLLDPSKMLAELRDQLAQPVRPLDFLAQIRLADLGPTDLALPPDGLLSFFYDTRLTPWGFDPADAGGARVLYTASADLPKAGERRRPDSDGLTAAECALAFNPRATLPAFEAESMDGIDKGDYRKARDLLAAAGGDQASHQVGGHDQPIQGDMRLECQLVTNGLYCGDSSGYSDQRRRALQTGAADWKLLFQIDTDEGGAGVDMGRLRTHLLLDSEAGLGCTGVRQGVVCPTVFLIIPGPNRYKNGRPGPSPGRHLNRSVRGGVAY